MGRHAEFHAGVLHQVLQAFTSKGSGRHAATGRDKATGAHIASRNIPQKSANPQRKPGGSPKHVTVSAEHSGTRASGNYSPKHSKAANTNSGYTPTHAAR